MDDSRASPQPSHASRSTSATLAGSPARDIKDHDHEDSPMRKRPRLEGSPSPSTATRDTEPQADPRNNPPTTPQRPQQYKSQPKVAHTTPNKVTLDLRSPADRMSMARAPSTSAISSPSATRHNHSPPPQAIEVQDDDEIHIIDSRYTPPKASSPPVVDISLDDTGSESDQWDLENIARSGIEDQLARLVNEFPWSNDQLTQSPVHIRNIVDLAGWFRKWINLTHQTPDLWPLIYKTHDDFFVDISQHVWKLLNSKRYSLPSSNSAAVATVIDASRDLLDAYFNLCSQFAVCDRELLLAGKYTRLQLRHGDNRQKHLKNLYHLVSKLEATSIWKIANDLRDLDARSTLIETAPILLTGRQFTSNIWFDLALGLTDALREEPALLATVLDILRIGRDALDYLTQSMVDPALHPGETEPLMLSTRELILGMRSCFFTAVEKSSSTIKYDFAKSFLDTLTESWGLAVRMAPQNPLDFLDPWGQASMTLGTETIVRLQTHALAITSARRLMSKGRLELRVYGTHMLGQDLHDLWVYTIPKIPLEEEQDAIRHCTASWLFEEKVVEQMVNVDTHPEVVQKGYLILGPLLITEKWLPSLTDTVMGAFAAIQDRHLKQSILVVLKAIPDYGRPRTLDHFMQRVCQMYEDAWYPGLVSLHYIAASRLWTESGDAEASRCIFRTAVRLLRSNAPRVRRDSDEAMQSVLEMKRLIKEMASVPGSEDGVQAVCSECVKDIESCSTTWTGSTLALEALLQSGSGPQVSKYLINTSSALGILVRALITNISTMRAETQPPQSFWISFTTMLNILVYLVRQQDSNFESDVESNLWRSLLGADAIDDRYRDCAWGALTRMCNDSPTSHDFLDRLIDQCLPILHPNFYTRGLIGFVQQAVHYRRRINNVSEVDGVGPTEIPMLDFLWKVILECPSDDVAHISMATICNLLVNSEAIINSPWASIAACHDTFIEKALKHMEECAENLRTESPKIDSDNSMIPLQPDSASSIKFKRAITCVLILMGEVQKDSRFTQPQDDRLSASPGSSKGSPVEESVTIKYQAFPPGRGISTLDLDPSMSRFELYDLLRRKTRFTEFRTISAGRALELRASSNDTIESLAKGGLLLVQNLKQDRLSPSAMDTSASRTTVGKALLARFDLLYPLLDLPDALSIDVFTLMRQVPPPTQLKDFLRSNSAPSDVFHPRRTYRTLYSLDCLLQAITRLNLADDDDRHCLQEMGRKLLRAFVDNTVAVLKLDSDQDAAIARSFLQGVRHCSISLTSPTDLAMFDADPSKVTARICEVLLRAKHSNVADIGSVERTAHECVVELARHNNEYLREFITHSDASQIHERLLILNTDTMARQHAQRCTKVLFDIATASQPMSNPSSAFAFWNLLVSILPACQASPEHSQQFFELIMDVCPLLGSPEATKTKIDMHKMVTDWLRLLVTRTGQGSTSHVEPEPLIQGLSKLIATCLSLCHPILQDIEATMWITDIFNKLLFPPIMSRATALHEPRASTAAVLHSEARKQLHELLLAMCSTSMAFDGLMLLLSNVPGQQIPDDLLGWRQNRFLLLRSPTGYAGLRNLTNTCYMNSLMTQLYMNPRFRDFMLSAPVSDRVAQKLLASTQDLFQYMQQSRRRYADTEDFAFSVKPYDGSVIDVAVQMDVDEFYNLLFEQWEDQILSKEAKKEFRSIYGGSSVTQVKSLDCDHISERVEDYLTVSCEIKGKHTLQDSLNAFIAGDSMEGDNKYKCEACGNRYVNAVKRSCLKDIPDNLTFHLKRFDFDLVSMQRQKLYDYFAFPSEIDMAPYKYETVTQNMEAAPSDIFELVGVLVHTGNAEVGHYYSYIRDSSSSIEKGAPWYEFNDTDVSDFDPNRLGDCCFGGRVDNEQWFFPKVNSAYMLFYKRKEVSNPPSSPAMSTAQVTTPPSPTDTSDEQIAQENDLLVRWFCLLDPEHGTLLQGLLTKLEDLEIQGNINDHEQHHRVRDMAAVCVTYLQLVASRLKDATTFEHTAFALETIVHQCAGCCADVLHMLTRGISDPLTEMLLHCPDDKIRTQTQDFFLALVQKLRDDPDSRDTLYGLHACEERIDVEVEPKGVFAQVVGATMRNLETIGEFSDRWTQFFSTLAKIANLGRLECHAFLKFELLSQCMMLLFTIDTGDVGEINLDSHYFEKNRAEISRRRKYLHWPSVLGLVATLTKRLDFGDSFDGLPGGRLEQPKRARNDLLRTTTNEQAMALLSDKGEAAFVARCQEAGEEDGAEALSLKSIVTQLLETAPQKHIILPVMKTLQRQIQDWDFPFQYLPLAVATPVCQLARDKGLVETLLLAIRKKICEFDRERKTVLDKYRQPSDYRDQHGKVISRFFMNLANMRTTQWASDDEQYPLMPQLLRDVASWGPRLLHLDSRENRGEALRAVQFILLRDVDVPQDDAVLSDIDVMRIKAWTKFAHGAIQAYSNYADSRLPSSVRQELMTALSTCMTLLRRVENQRPLVPAYDVAFDQIREQYARTFQQYNELRMHHG